VSNLPNRATLIAIGAVIALPLIFAALGAGQSAGLVLGVGLVVVGLGWTLLGSREAGDDEDPRP
jgi:hypothetical protein